MRRIVLMGFLAALLASSASLALADGRYDARTDWRSNDADWQGARVAVRFDSGWDRDGYGWGQGRHVQNDRRFDRGESWRFARRDDRFDRGERWRFDRWNDRRDGRRFEGSDRGWSRDGRDGYDNRWSPSWDGRDDDRRSAPMNDRGW